MNYMLFAREQEKKSLAWYVETNSQGDTQEGEITHAHPESGCSILHPNLEGLTDYFPA